VAAAALALALAGSDGAAKKPEAKPDTSHAVESEPPAPTPNPPKAAPAQQPLPIVAPTSAAPAPPPKPTPSKAEPSPAPTKAKPRPTPPRPAPKPTPPPAPAPAVYQWNELKYGITGDGTAPEMRLGESSWVWQRWGVSVGDRQYAHGVTVHGRSSVTIDLNRSCTAYDAMVGVDDMTLGLGRLRFSVYADGVRQWQSPLIRGGDPAVPVHVNLSGRKTIRLVVEPHTAFDSVALADWAESKFMCR
jgi:hypothetical protein